MSHTPAVSIDMLIETAGVEHPAPVVEARSTRPDDTGRAGRHRRIHGQWNRLRRTHLHHTGQLPSPRIWSNSPGKRNRRNISFPAIRSIR